MDSSSGNWVRIKSITDLRVFFFVGSSEPKYFSTELNLDRLRERGWRIVLRSMSIHDFRAALGGQLGVSIPNYLAYEAGAEASMTSAMLSLSYA